MTKPPSHLEKAGRELWQGLIRDYGITDTAGTVLVTTAAECLDRMRSAQELVKKHGECITAGNGSLKTNPACRVEQDARSGMLSALRMLNLDLEPLRDGPGRPGG